MRFPLTLAALSLSTSLLASACALEEGEDLELGETESALVDYDDWADGGSKEIAVAETDGAEAVIAGQSGTVYGLGQTTISGQVRMALRLLSADGTYTTRNALPTGETNAWAHAAANIGGLGSEVILAAGAAGDQSSHDLMLSRIRPTGIDTTYSGDGFNIINATTEPYEEGREIVTLGGKIYVGGEACHADPYIGLACRVFLIRLTSDGYYDSTYGVHLFAAAPVPFQTELLRGLAPDADGGLIVVTEQRQSNNSSDVVVRRVTPTVIDQAFAGGTGQRRFTYAAAGGVAIDPSSRRIVVGGNAVNGSTQYVWQMSYNGNLIPGFGGTNNISSGWAKVDYTSRAQERLGDVKIDSAGRILLLGSAWQPSAASFTLVRLLSNGSPDTTFDNDDGKEFVTFTGSSDSFGLSLYLDNATHTILAGGLGLSGDVEKFVFARIVNP